MVAFKAACCSKTGATFTDNNFGTGKRRTVVLVVVVVVLVVIVAAVGVVIKENNALQTPAN